MCTGMLHRKIFPVVTQWKEKSDVILLLLLHTCDAQQDLQSCQSRQVANYPVSFEQRICLWMLIMALRVNLVCLMWVRSHYCYAAYAFKAVIFKYLLVRPVHILLRLLCQCRLLTGSQWGFGFSWWSLQHSTDIWSSFMQVLCTWRGVMGWSMTPNVMVRDWPTE